MKYTLHLMAHEKLERFAGGVMSSNKVRKLLAEGRRFREIDGFRYRWKWKIVRNSDNVIIAQSKNYKGMS